MVAAIVQARLSSKRLPGKVMKTISGKPMLYWTISRLKGSRNIDKIIVATSNSARDEKIVRLAKRLKVEYFQGAEDDVLDRFYQTARKFKADTIVRITGDCPLIDRKIVETVISFYKKNKGKFDYVSNVEPPTFPDGMDVEVFPLKTLKLMHSKAKLLSDREHVTTFVRNRPRQFRIGNVYSKKDFSGIRLTVDSKEDLFVIRKLFSRLYGEKKDFGLRDIIRLSSKEPELFLANKHIKRNEGYIFSVKNDIRVG